MKDKQETQERYKQVRKLVARPFYTSKNQLFGREYTGCEPLGFDSVDNTYGQLEQLAVALSLSENESVDDILFSTENRETLQAYRVEAYQEHQEQLDRIAQQLARQQVLGGMKILDLGSGPTPAFANCARSLGAQVYTTDSVDVRKLDDVVMGAQQKTNHVRLDLREPNALDVLRDRTGGEMDLVTSSFIHVASASARFYGRAAPPRHLTSLALALVKPDGVYVDVDPFNYNSPGGARIHHKEPGIDYKAEVERAVRRRDE